MTDADVNEMPPVESVFTRARSLRTRRRILGACVGVVSLAGVLGVTAAVTGDDTPDGAPVVAAYECEVVNEGVPRFASSGAFEVQAAAGERITVQGDGFYTGARTGTVELAAASDLAGDGRADVLATFEVLSECHFETTFDIPQLSSGTHEARVRLLDADSTVVLSSPLTLQVP